MSGGCAILQVGAKAAAIYLLHTTGVSYYAGSVVLEYSDGSRMVDHIGPGKISNWWYPSAPQDRKQVPRMRVAWRGQNKHSRNVGVCIYGLDNPNPQKEISAIRFRSAGNSTRWMVLGVTLSDRPVYFRPDKISAGIPDNWGAAAVVYALVEGLCGVKDRGRAFSRLELSPRWSICGEEHADVCVKYPASQGYVSYRYRQDEDSCSLHLTGSHEQADLRILLPEGSRPSKLLVNGKEASFDTERVALSDYMLIRGLADRVNQIEIRLTPSSLKRS